MSRFRNYDPDVEQHPGCTVCRRTRCAEGFRHGKCRECVDMDALRCVDCDRVTYGYMADASSGRCKPCAVATVQGGA